MPRTYGTTTQRGYDARHQAKRAEWKPKVEAGHVDCHATLCLEERDGHTRWIQPGTPWHLGHTPDRSQWTGPEHQRCNTSEGATRGNQQRRRDHSPTSRPSTTIAPRRWIL